MLQLIQVCCFVYILKHTSTTVLFTKTETVDCGVLYNIENAEVILVNGSTEYGSEAVYNCTEQGYELLGNENRFCSENGTWNGTEPTCQIIQCNEPDSFDNGQWQGDSLTYGSSLYYTCNNGYTNLTEHFIITCGANKLWDYTLSPVCSPIDCGDPGSPQNGSQSGTYTFNSTVEFSCDEGYTLLSQSNESIIICLANGSWSDDIPICVLVTCEAPPIPQNGSIVGSDTYTFMTSIIYECDEGYILNGSNITTCTANQEWSHGPPECIRTCGDFNFPNGSKEPNGGSYIASTILQLSCSTGYELTSGENVMECLENGEWNITIPECIGQLTSQWCMH